MLVTVMLILCADGMQALFNVSLCAGETDSVTPLNGTVRKYFIAAELVRWNYAPSGIDSLTNVSLTESGRYGAVIVSIQFLFSIL